MYKLTEINIYPIKSLAGISLQSSEVKERGLKYDRRWMLVYENGMFFTQRNHPQMALLQPRLVNGTIQISHKQPKMNDLTIPSVPDGDSKIEVTVWDDKVSAQTYSREIDEWFSEALEVRCRLVYMPDSTERNVNPKYAKEKMEHPALRRIVSFADAYPFMIIGEESLADLNNRMDEPLPMNRFRTNFVFSGGKPFDEDNWEKIKIGNLEFWVVKSCARCTITTINQSTGEKEKEPLSTLATFRKVNGKVLFGQNMVCESTGIVRLGDTIRIDEWNADSTD